MGKGLAEEVEETRVIEEWKGERVEVGDKLEA